MRGTTAGKTARKTEEARLWARFLANPTERRHEALWTLYQPLVRHLAERFNEKRGQSLDIADSIAAGNVGLLDALAEFQPGAKAFVAHAGPLIRDAIRRSLPVQRTRPAERLVAESGAAHAEQRVQSCDPLGFPRESNLLQLQEHLRRFACLQRG